MKKILFLLPLLLVGTLSSCSQINYTLTFEQDEYEVSNGDTIRVTQHDDKVDYRFVGEVPEGVTLDEDNGIISFVDTVPNSSQVLYQAYNDVAESDMVVLTLLHEQKAGTLSFLNLTDKIIDGDYIIATNSEGNAIKYTLKEDVYGVSIDSSSGRVSFTESCHHNQEFTVVISSKNSESVEKKFYTAIDQLVVSKNHTQACEENGDVSVSYFLDFSNAPGDTKNELIGILHGKTILNEEDYTYDAENHQVFIKSSFLNTVNFGETNICLVTERNNINVNLLKATKFIREPQDLVSINNDPKSLSGHYILANDIDLTSYLGMSGEGYNDGKGWNPIGTYRDVTDGTATANAFTGTFDGNGYTISGLKINRSDEFAYNAGLFGYVDSLGNIKNLTVKSDGQLSVRSFSGILAGNNQGKIENCYVEGSITNYSGENLFKNLGIICGTNGGEIVNCIANGVVDGDAYFGVLTGSNEGTIINCYSVGESNDQIGVGNVPVNSHHFNSVGELQNFDFTGKLDEKHWEISANSIPKTTQYLEYFSLYSIQIVEPSKEFYTKGDRITISVKISPANLHNEYISSVKYTVEGEGLTIDGNKVSTESATVNEFHISVSLEAQGELFVDTKQFILYDKIEEIVVDESVETLMNAGSSYRLKANVYPITANQDVSWRLGSTYKGITLSEDVVSISEDCTLTSFSVYAYNGTKRSSKYNINVNTIKQLENGTIVMYKSELKDLVYNFPSDVSLEGVKAYIDNTEINIKEVGEHSVTISSEYVEMIHDKTIKFKFVLLDGSMYRAFATYFTRDIYDEEYVAANHSEYHTIGSVEDFAKYFNIFDSEDPVLGYSLDKHQYYDDVFVLTNDIDFEGGKMFGIGTFDSDTGTGQAFTGVIYGQGYSFKNVNIQDNEKWFTNEDKTGNYRNSLYAVGFFGTFSGRIYDTVFDNVNVSANNWVAGFACTIGVDGYLENIKFVNSTVTSTGGTQGKIYCTNNGSNNLIVVTFNGESSNLGR